MFSAEWPDWAAARAAINAGRIDAATLWRSADEQIRRRESTVRALVHWDREGSRRTAEHPAPGPLSGCPIVVKDLADVQGMPTTAASGAYRGRGNADRDAVAVARLRAAGAVVLGKANTEELAFGVVSAPTTNPWNSAHIPGGSSGGTAAAVAAGFAMAGLGTDTAGSIRIPAALCGVVGMKPTLGAVPLTGVMPLAPSFDVVGPLAQSAADAALLLGVMMGDTDPPPLKVAPPRRVLVPAEYWQGRLDDVVADHWEAALGRLDGAHVPVDLVDLPDWTAWRAVFLTMRRAESYRVHRAVLEGPGRARLPETLAARLDEGRSVSAVEYLDAVDARHRLVDRVARLLGEDAMLVLPTVGVVAPAVGTERVALKGGTVSLWEALVALTLPASVLGFPAVTVPMGRSADELPTGLQIVGRPGSDTAVLGAGQWFLDLAGGRGG
jgi:aspartyl-tRNA(Asn)/glutamyl-tRNA(Gln) amidotransferase subunit A